MFVTNLFCVWFRVAAQMVHGGRGGYCRDAIVWQCEAMRLDSRWPKFWWDVYLLLIVCINPRMASIMCWCLLWWGIQLRNKCDILVQWAKTLTLNTTRASHGKILPQGYSHRYIGFLLKNNKCVVRVVEDVKTEMAYLHDHTIITNFIGEKPSSNPFNVWLVFLNKKMGDKVLFDCFLGKRFFMLKLDRTIMVKKLLMLTPFKTDWGLIIF